VLNECDLFKGMYNFRRSWIKHRRMQLHLSRLVAGFWAGDEGRAERRCSSRTNSADVHSHPHVRTILADTVGRSRRTRRALCLCPWPCGHG